MFFKGDSGVSPDLQNTVNNHFTLRIRQEPPPKGESLPQLCFLKIKTLGADYKAANNY